MRFGKKGNTIQLFSCITGKPFTVDLYNYPFGELPRIPTVEIEELKKKKKLSDVEKALVMAELLRAKRKSAYFSGTLNREACLSMYDVEFSRQEMSNE